MLILTLDFPSTRLGWALLALPFALLALVALPPVLDTPGLDAPILVALLVAALLSGLLGLLFRSAWAARHALRARDASPWTLGTLFGVSLGVLALLWGILPLPLPDLVPAPPGPAAIVGVEMGARVRHPGPVPGMVALPLHHTWQAVRPWARSVVLGMPAPLRPAGVPVVVSAVVSQASDGSPTPR